MLDYIQIGIVSNQCFCTAGYFFKRIAVGVLLLFMSSCSSDSAQQLIDELAVSNSKLYALVLDYPMQIMAETELYETIQFKYSGNYVLTLWFQEPPISKEGEYILTTGTIELFSPDKSTPLFSGTLSGKFDRGTVGITIAVIDSDSILVKTDIIFKLMMQVTANNEADEINYPGRVTIRRLPSFQGF